ncbi:unnamed protein product [Cercopithifilaria johnstoni]|uniref:Sodefrin-like factor n=1 Tax=Cercopithifilaria johnstoni TaxID=2874296 RepID=A0A8J2M4I3_9BILA|nr:unnamed protein product [Cercopithifilaria johnstoni]
MKKCLEIIIWLTLVTQKVVSIKCAECNYLPHSPISGIRTCPKNCHGDICFIVVNKYYNETLISGCVNIDIETRIFFHDQAYCYDKSQYTVCGCTTFDRCNSPQAPLSMFTFITTPFFESCQFVPKNENNDCNSFQRNITLEEDNSKIKLLLKAQPKEDGKSINTIEITTKNVDINDRSLPVAKSTTSHSTVVSYSMKSTKSSSDENNKNEISSEFIDEVIRSLIPNTDQHYMNPEFDYGKFNDQTKDRKKLFCKICSK